MQSMNEDGRRVIDAHADTHHAAAPEPVKSFETVVAFYCISELGPPGRVC